MTQDLSAPIQHCCSYISAHLGDVLTLPVLAHQAEHEVYYFSKKFKRETGLSPSAYVRAQRLAHAAMLLRTTEQTVADISRQMRFCSAGHFAGVFRREYGMTPEQYRIQSGEAVVTSSLPLQTQTIDLTYYLQEFYEAFGLESHIFSSNGTCAYAVHKKEAAVTQKAAAMYDILFPVDSPEQALRVGQDETNLLFWGVRADAQSTVVFGPVANTNFTEKQRQKYCHVCGISDTAYQIGLFELGRLLHLMALSCYAINGLKFDAASILAECSSQVALNHWDEVAYEFEQYEMGLSRMSYETESAWYQHIVEGNLEWENSIQDFSTIGTMVKNNELKQLEYAMVASITLATRAAIQGGIPPLESYRASDLMLQKLANCNTLIDIMNVSAAADKQFTQMVHDHKKRCAGALTEQCKSYIYNRLYKSISVAEMAKALGVSRSHLSAQFKQSMGMSLQEYILQVRLDTAAHLLCHSERTVSQIADDLHFSSAGRLSNYFKQAYGQTPLSYRKQNNMQVSSKMDKTNS